MVEEAADYIEHFWLISVIDGWYKSREPFGTLGELVTAVKKLKADNPGKRVQAYTFYGEEGIITKNNNGYALHLCGSTIDLDDPPVVTASVVHDCDISEVDQEDPDYSKATKSLLQSAENNPIFAKVSKKLTDDDGEDGDVDEGDELQDET
jgi:hypothetical protein